MLANLLNGPIESLLSSFNSGVITDIVILLIITLFALICCIRGFSKQLMGLVVTIGSIVIAYVFCDKLLLLLDKNFDLTLKLSEKIYGAFGDKLALQLEPTIENIHDAIISAGLPEFVANYAKSALESATGEYATIGNFLAQIVAHHILSAACFFGLWLISKLVLTIVKIILSKLIVNIPLVRSVDRILGLVLGVIKAAALIYLLIYVIDILPKSIGIINTLSSAIEQSVVGVFFKQHNLFAMLVSSIMNSFSF